MLGQRGGGGWGVGESEEVDNHQDDGGAIIVLSLSPIKD